MEEQKTSSVRHLTTVLLVVIMMLVAVNTVQIAQMDGLKPSVTAQVIGDAAEPGEQKIVKAGLDVIPIGIPEIYGQELSVKFSDVSPDSPQIADATIRKLAVLDQQITLTGEDMQRYIRIASQMSCEYCCGAESIIFENGQAACGCAHSFAMRGLAKYLIQNHGDEYTDEQILEEMGKWKTLFFPGLITQKAQALQDQGIELNYINLASNKYRGIEQGAADSGMVGGC